MIQASALSPTNNLHWFQSLMITPMNGVLSSLAGQDSYDLWHTRFGHLLKNALQQAPLHVTGLPIISVPVSSPSCKGCAMGKMADRPFLSSDKRAARPLALVHTDLIGPMPVEPRSHAKYGPTFIDDHSGYALVAFIRNKDATVQHFQSMACWAETFTSQSLTSVRSDCGGNSWAKSFKRSFCPEALHIKLQFPIHPNKMVVQRGSIKLCLKKLKPFDNMLVCLDLSGKMQLKQPCTSITNNQCVVINGGHPLKFSMKTSLMFHTSGYLAHTLTCLYPQNSDEISCLLRPRR